MEDIEVVINSVYAENNYVEGLVFGLISASRRMSATNFLNVGNTDVLYEVRDECIANNLVSVGI